MHVAIIGAGISGLGAAYLLHPHHTITVYEKNDYLGGHSRTVDVHTSDGVVPVDTGFIVFNYRNYPNLSGLFKHLGVEVAKSNMSFGVSINDGWLEYGTQQLAYVFAQSQNLFRPAFWKMLTDILRFNQDALRSIEDDEKITLGQLLDRLNMGPWFRDYYLLAMGGAIWSTPLAHMLDFPAAAFIRFFENHGLLTVNDQPQWHTVVGGSREYVKKLSEPFKDCIRNHCGVQKVVRTGEGVEVVDVHGNSEHYDQVIFACHSDQALAILDNPLPLEKELIGAFRYQPNTAVLHRDTRFMPKRRKAWSSWVYLSEERQDKNPSVSLSYWMNNLQPLATNTPIIVTLNPGREPDPSLVHDRFTFEHPVFDQAAISAQSRLNEIQGTDRIWYCGAWHRYGFHEDGLWSAVNVAEQMGVPIPWK